MESSFRIGRLFGIEIGINLTWFLVVALITFTLATGYYPAADPDLGAAVWWIMGFISALLLFVSVLIHELAHSLVARAKGLEVTEITLHLFGGVSNIQRQPPSPGLEFLITVVGPLSSLLIGVVCFAIYALTSDTSGVVSTIAGYLAIVNILLAVFNLIPGFPLDGGRILHAIVWKISGSRTRATRIASGAGIGVAILFIAGGLLLALRAEGFISGIWLAFIGWFLLQASASRFRSASEQLKSES